MGRKSDRVGHQIQNTVNTMTAEQVRVITHESGQQEYKAAIDSIKFAAKKGYYTCLFTMGITDSTVHRLEQDGFNVFSQDGKDDYERNVVVSWWPEKAIAAATNHNSTNTQQ